MNPPAPSPVTLSIIVTVYHNERSLPTALPSLARVARGLTGDAFELICVDDGSRDRSHAVLEQLQADVSLRLRIVKLTRNFGAMSAVQAGLVVARGAAVGVFAADEQDPPELFAAMHQHWQAGAKCVYALRTDREDGFFGKLWAGFFYALLRRFALPGYPSGGYGFFLLDRQVVDELVKLDEKNTHITNLIYWMGHPSVTIPYQRRPRVHGRSSWTFGKKLKLFLDSFVAFSYAPVRLVTVVGLLFFLLSIVYGAIQIYYRLTHGTPVVGFTTIVALIALTSGVQMMMLGILGEYLWRTLDAARSRPGYVVEKIQEPPRG